MRLSSLVSFALLIATAAPSLADWSAPAQVGDNAYRVSNGSLFPDAANGGVVSLLGTHHLTQGARRMNRVTPAGALPAGWNAAGTDLFVDDGVPLARFAADASGGLWYAYPIGSAPTGISLYRYRADGGLSGPFAVIASGAGTQPSIAADGTGGVFVSWPSASLMAPNRLKRVQANGAIDPAWGASGVPVGNVTNPQALCTDGAGGAYVLGGFIDSGTGLFSTRVWRLSAAGAHVTGWTAAGLAIDGLVGSAFALHRLDATHVLAVWYDGASTRMTRVNSNGTLDPAWPARGLVIATGSRVQPDGFGGCYLFDAAAAPPVLWHVFGDATFDPAFGGVAGMNPLDGGAVLDAERLRACTAPGANGNVVVLWRDLRTGAPQVRARWLRADGTNDPSELAEGRVVATAGAGLTPVLLDARSDGAGGALLLWTADTTGYDPQFVNYWYDSYVTRVGTGAFLGVPPSPTALALAAGPNPAHGTLTARFTLPDARPARLELLDLAGRRLAARDVAGPGAHAEPFAEAASLPPGVYLLRLAHGGALRTARVALIR